MAIVTTLIMHFGSLCAYSNKVIPLWGYLLGFVYLLLNFSHTTKNLLVLYKKQLYHGVLHELFVRKRDLNVTVRLISTSTVCRQHMIYACTFLFIPKA